MYPARGKMLFPQHWRPACNGVLIIWWRIHFKALLNFLKVHFLVTFTPYDDDHILWYEDHVMRYDEDNISSFVSPSSIIDYHWLSLIINDYHRLSLIIIDCHWLSLIITEYTWLSLIIIEYYRLSLIISDYLTILKRWVTDSLTTWNQEMLAHLKKPCTFTSAQLMKSRAVSFRYF